MTMRCLIVKLLDVSSNRVVVDADRFKVRVCVHDIIAALIDLALHSLDLLINLDAFLAPIVNILLDLVELSLKVTNNL